MIESPVLDEAYELMRVISTQDILVDLIGTKHGLPVPEDVVSRIRMIEDRNRLKELCRLLVTCPTLDSFVAELDKK